MKQHSKNKKHHALPLKAIIVMTFILAFIALTTSAFKHDDPVINIKDDGDDDDKNVNADSTESAQAFLEVYKVLMSPRCMNCHPAGNRPLQDDDSHVHIMNVLRGKDGKGLYALKCTNCHQPENTPGINSPPGNPKWQLPPANMKMVFEGRNAHDLALQIMDYNRNGHKNKEQLIEHARDTLVKAGWHMGEGRMPPPLAYDEFLKVWDTWINKGGYAPAKEN